LSKKIKTVYDADPTAGDDLTKEGLFAGDDGENTPVAYTRTQVSNTVAEVGAVKEIADRVGALETDTIPDPASAFWNVTILDNTLTANVLVSMYTGEAFRIVKDDDTTPTDDSVGSTPPTGFTSGSAPSTYDMVTWVAGELYFYQWLEGTGITEKLRQDGGRGITVSPIYTLRPVTPNAATFAKDVGSPTDTLAYDWDGVTHGGPVGTAGLVFELYELSQVDDTLTRLVSDITTLPATLVGRIPGTTHNYILRVVHGPNVTDFVDSAPGTVVYDSAPAGTVTLDTAIQEFAETDDTIDGAVQITVYRSIAGPAEGTVDIITSDSGHTLVAGTNYVERVEHTTGITLTRVDATTANCQLTDHGLVTGQHARVSGETPAAYNGTFSVTRIDNDNFRYTTASDVVNPGAGTAVIHCGVVWWDAADNTDYTYKVKLIDASMSYNRTAEIHIADGSETGGLVVDTNALASIFQVNGTGEASNVLQEAELDVGGVNGFVIDFAGATASLWTFRAGVYGKLYSIDTGETPDALGCNSNQWFTVNPGDIPDAPSADIQIEVLNGGKNWYAWVYAKSPDDKDTFWSAIDDVVMDDFHKFTYDGSYHWDRITNGVTIAVGEKTYSIKVREPAVNIKQERVIIVDDAAYDPATASPTGLNETLSSGASGVSIDDPDNVYTPFGPDLSGTLSPTTLFPVNAATEITISQPAEAFFAGASYDPLIHGVIDVSAKISGEPLSTQSAVFDIRPDGVAIRILPSTVWPYSVGTAITFDIVGKLESGGEIKTIDVGTWAFEIVAAGGPAGVIMYQDNEGLLITDDPVVVRQQLYSGYMAKSDVGVLKLLPSGEINYATTFVQDPLGQHGKVMRCEKAGGEDSYANVIQLRMMFDRDGTYPMQRYDDIYLYFDFMLPTNMEWPASSKLGGLFCYLPSVGGGDVTGGGDCTSGFAARLSMGNYTKYSYLTSLVPDGIAGVNPYGYNYWYARNYTPASTVYGRNAPSTDPAHSTFSQTPDSGETPVGLLKGYWNSVEIRCKVNTNTPAYPAGGDPTGSLYEVWLNGFKTVSLNGLITWRPPTGSPGLVGDPTNYGIQEAWLQIYHGGGDYTSGSSTRNFYHFDNVTISESRIGQIDRSSPLIIAP